MEKTKVLQAIIQSLAGDFAVVFHAARAAHQASIHEENIPDNKYDTLSLEASYVAQGQANRAQEIRAALDRYRNLPMRRFSAEDRIRLSALVALEDEAGMEKLVFLGPAAGGIKVNVDEGEVTVITPESPLGQRLLGLRAGEVVEVSAGECEREYEITAVW